MNNATNRSAMCWHATRVWSALGRGARPLQHEQPELIGRAIAVRTDDRTYVHRLYESDELYQRRGDSGAVTNRVDDPALAPVVHELQHRRHASVRPTKY